jgi:hypothetical protein
MSTDMQSEPFADAHRSDGRNRETVDGTAWSGALSWWRCLPAEAFIDAHKAHLDQCVADISCTIEMWRKAIAGDAAAAVNIALRMRLPAEVTPWLDLTMTILLRSAFKNPRAAFVLSELIRRMPLDETHKNRIATSWLVHSQLHSNPVLPRTGHLRRPRSIASQLLTAKESSSRKPISSPEPGA